MHCVVLAAGGRPTGGERGVEIVKRAFFSLAGRDQPRDTVVGDPHCAAPSLDLHLEQDLIIDGRNALLRGVLVGKPLADLCQQRVGQLVQRCVGRRHSLPEILAQTSQRGPCQPGHRSSFSSTPPTASSSSRVMSASIATRDARLPSSWLSNSRIPACISSRRAFR